MLALFPLTSFAFYAGPAPAVFVVWVPMVFCSMGGRIILRSLSTELFATAHRAAASGLFTVAETIGAVAGLLAMHAFGTADVVAVARVVPLVAALVLVSAACLLAFPEARHRELEDLSAAH
jgi:hypothetical protein